MKKYIKRFFLILGIFILILIALSAIVAGLFGDTIGKQVLEEVKKTLKTELVVEDVDLGFFRSFPKASVNLKGVELEDAFRDQLMKAEEISFRFGLFGLLASQVNIQSVVIRNGALNIKINRKGEANYDIMKPSETESSSSESTDLAISLQEARLINMEIGYMDKPNRQSVRALIDNALFSGEFSSEKFTLASKADIFSRYLDLDGDRFLVDKSLGYEARIAVDMTQQTYTFDKVDLRLDRNVFGADGVIQQKDNSTTFDIYLNSEEGNIEGIIGLLPESYLQYVGGLTSTGNFYLEGRIDGTLSEQDSPEITASFGLKNGKLESPNFKDPLSNVSFEARFTNGTRRNNATTTFELRGFKGTFGRELINMDFRVRNLDDPQITFFLDGAFPLGSVYEALGSDLISKGSGKVAFREINMEGLYNDMIRPSRISRVKSTGRVQFTDATLTLNNRELSIEKGLLTLRNNELEVTEFALKAPGTALNMTGRFSNILPVLLADSLNSNSAELKFTATLDATELDIDELLAMTTSPVKEGEVAEVVYDSIKTAETQNREWFTSFLDGNFNAKVASFNYGEIEGKDFAGQLVFENNEMLIEGKTNAMKGQITLEGKLFFEDRPQIQARLQTDGTDIKEFFRQAQNFGQEVLTHEEVSGTLNSKTLIYAYFDNQGNFLMDELIVFSALGLNNGELVNFEMLEDFSNYVKIQDLRHIRFQNLVSYLQINKGRILIPSLFIQSNALNLTLSGEHSFENDIDYNIKVNAGQVVANKFKNYNPDMEPIKAQRRGWFNLYFKIFGDLEKFDYKMAKREVKTDFARSEYVKAEIKRAIISAFGSLDLLEEPDDWADIPEYGEPQDPEEVEYLDGF